MGLAHWESITEMPIDPSIPLQGGDIAPPVNMLGMVKDVAGLQNTMAATASTKQATAQSGADDVAKRFVEFLALPPQHRTQAAARQLVQYNVQTGATSPQSASAAMDAIANTKVIGPDGRVDVAASQAALDNLAHRAIIHTLSGPEKMRALFGDNIMVDTGAVQQPMAASTPLQRAIRPGTPGLMPTGGDVTNQLPPGGQIAPTSLPEMRNGTPTGRSEVVPGAEVARRAGLPGLIPGDGRLRPTNPALLNPNRQPPVQGASFGSTLAPAERAAQDVTGGSSAKAFQDIADQAVQARSQDAILANMQADAAQFTTGAGADKIKAFQNGIVRVMGPNAAAAFGISPDRLAANESFDKLANQIANAQGAGSDARLAVNQAANPSSHTSPAGVDMILRQLRGNSDYLKARAALAAQHPNQADRAGFEAIVGDNLDPRVFQYSRLKPDQKGAYVKSLTDAPVFMKAYKWAEDNRLIGGAGGGR